MQQAVGHIVCLLLITSRYLVTNNVFPIQIDLKKLYFMAGVDYKPTIFLFNDTQVLDESFLEDINNILSSGEVPNLYKPDEFEEVSVN